MEPPNPFRFQTHRMIIFTFFLFFSFFFLILDPFLFLYKISYFLNSNFLSISTEQTCNSDLSPRILCGTACFKPCPTTCLPPASGRKVVPNPPDLPFTMSSGNTLRSQQQHKVFQIASVSGSCFGVPLFPPSPRIALIWWGILAPHSASVHLVGGIYVQSL